MVDDFEIKTTGRDLRQISKALRGVDNREIKKKFTKELRAAAKPMVPAVRQSIKAIPSKSAPRKDGRLGLRRQMSKATKLTVKTAGRNASVNIRVDGRKMGPKMGSLPAYMEGTKSPWRHPVHGQDWWVSQASHPFFERALSPLRASSRRAIQRAVDSITRDIT